jgi:hypothetical protein
LASEPLFNRSFKLRNRLIAATGMLVAAALPFVLALGALGLLEMPHHGSLPGMITAAAFFLAALLPWQAQNVLSLSGNRGLRRHVLKKLALERPEELHDADQFVGFAPGDHLRMWDGETDCDVGFLTLLPTAIAFVGDRYSWSLRREHVDRVELTPPTGGIRRIVVRWHAPRESGRAFTLESRDGPTLRSTNRSTSDLSLNLQRWHASEATAGEAPHLGNPPTDAPGGVDVLGPAPGSCAATLCMVTITALTIWRVAGDFIEQKQYYYGILSSGLITVMAAGLTFHLLSYLQAWAAKLPKKPAPRPPMDGPMM